MRTDVVRMYKDIHSWVGIFSGLALFIAFYAGAITMFEDQLQRWASPPTTLSPPLPIERTPELIEKAIAAHPDAAKSYTIHLDTGPERPARMSWSTGGRREGGERRDYFASLSPDGSLQVIEEGPSPVAQLIDVLHQQVGLPFEHEVSMPIMGAVSLLYAVALVSGTIVLLASIAKDLFAMRISANLKRMWLDLHNVLGLFSLPFHIVMALTAIVFAFHDQFYDVQGAVAKAGTVQEQRERPASKKPDGETKPSKPLLPPAGVITALGSQAPGFTVDSISYSDGERGQGIRAAGRDPRYGLRGPTTGFATLDPQTGAIKEADYMPGHQGGWNATISSFFTLHFGSFGGAPIRWAYFLLGLAGAFLFYSGNLIWIESRRKKSRKNSQPEQTRSNHVLGALTTGVSLGCIAGISTTIAAARWLPGHVADLAAWHSYIYYTVFVVAVGWAFLRGAARSGYELLILAAITTAAIPLSTLATMHRWDMFGSSIAIDVTATIGAVAYVLFAWFARRRTVEGPRDSIWSNRKLTTSGQ